MKTCIARTYGEVMGEDTCPCWPKKKKKKKKACAVPGRRLWPGYATANGCHCLARSVHNSRTKQLYVYLATLGADFITWCNLHRSRSSTRYVHNWRKSQLYTCVTYNSRPLHFHVLWFWCNIRYLSNRDDFFHPPKWKWVGTTILERVHLLQPSVSYSLKHNNLGSVLYLSMKYATDTVKLMSSSRNELNCTRHYK